MKSILKLKHWQVFIILIVGLLLNNFTIEDNQTLTTIFSITGAIIYFMWPLLVGHGLYQILLDRINLNYNFFIINSFVWLTAWIIIMIMSDGQGMIFNGVAALPGFYVFYALLYYLAFPARTLKSIEKGKKADFGEYIGDFFLIVFLPIGIWFLQPRINRVIRGQEGKMVNEQQLS